MSPVPSSFRLSMIFLTTSWLQRQSRLLVSSWSLQSGRSYSRTTRRRIPRSCRAVSDLLESTSSAQQQQQSLLQQDESASAPQAPAKFVPFPFQYRQEIEVEIESLTNQGLGIARVPILDDRPRKNNQSIGIANTDANDEDVLSSSSLDSSPSSRPWVIMVPNVIPGERVVARVFRNYPSYSEADFVRVMDGCFSPDRILEPPCAILEECGGCQYQHISIDRQRSIKTQHTKEAFQQYGLLLDDADNTSSNNILHPCTGTNQTFGYRSKLTPHYDAPRHQATPVIGFQRQMSRQVIDVESCCIATPPVNAKYQQVRQDLLQRLAEQQRTRNETLSAVDEASLTKKQRRQLRKPMGATLLFRQGNLNDDHVSTTHSDTMRTTVHGVHFDYQAGNFFQNNYHVLPLMVDLVLTQATKPLECHAAATESSSFPTHSPTHLIDCYCGSGLFAISCAARAKPAFARVIGIEINAKAIDEATRNAALNGLTADQVSFVAASAENIFAPVSNSQRLDAEVDVDASAVPSSSNFPPDKTVVVIDPPRKGCSPQFLELLLEFAPARVVYVSCNVVTQGRDAQVLVDGGYECTYIQPLDLFPQTRHVECVATFERRR